MSLPGAPRKARKGWNISVDALHYHLKRLKPKTGICDFCKAETRTDYALIHECTYQLMAENFLELCRSCHNCYDKGEIDLLELHIRTGRFVP